MRRSFINQLFDNLNIEDSLGRRNIFFLYFSRHDLGRIDLDVFVRNAKFQQCLDRHQDIFTISERKLFLLREDEFLDMAGLDFADLETSVLGPKVISPLLSALKGTEPQTGSLAIFHPFLESLANGTILAPMKLQPMLSDIAKGNAFRQQASRYLSVRQLNLIKSSRFQAKAGFPLLHGPAILVSPLHGFLMPHKRLDPDSPPRLDPADHELFLLTKFIVTKIGIGCLDANPKIPAFIIDAREGESYAFELIYMNFMDKDIADISDHLVFSTHETDCWIFVGNGQSEYSD